MPESGPDPPSLQQADHHHKLSALNSGSDCPVHFSSLASFACHVLNPTMPASLSPISLRGQRKLSPLNLLPTTRNLHPCSPSYPLSLFPSSSPPPLLSLPPAPSPLISLYPLSSSPLPSYSQNQLHQNHKIPWLPFALCSTNPRAIASPSTQWKPLLSLGLQWAQLWLLFHPEDPKALMSSGSGFESQSFTLQAPPCGLSI